MSNNHGAGTAKLNSTGMGASITVKDIAASLDWYEHALGFKVDQRYEREGTVVGAAIVAGRLKAHGTKLLNEPADYPWGQRMFQFFDADGYKWCVSMPVGGATR